MSTIKCQSLSDLAGIILIKNSLINLNPYEIGIETPSNLFIFLFGILNECLVILCQSNTVTMDAIDIVREKIKNIGIELFIKTTDNPTHMGNSIQFFVHKDETSIDNLKDYKVKIQYPDQTYTINFDFVNAFKYNCKVINLVK